MLKLLRDAADYLLLLGTGRSPKWPHLRREHLKLQPQCEACLSKDDLEVHHVEPYHLFPERELDPANLMTLCGDDSNGCHRRVGHSLKWQAYNPNAREDAAVQILRIRNRLYWRITQ